MATLFFNLIQSTNPCSDCEDASSGGSMTMRGWEGSSYGVPGSKSRVCEDNCHCLLVSDGTELPKLGDALLRGDKKTDIPKITGEFPLEIRLDELTFDWRAKFGDMPGRFLKMDLSTLIKTLESELGIT